MLRSCVCLGRRTSASLDDSSSCRSSEIERGADNAVESGRRTASDSSLLQYFLSKSWFRHWQRSSRAMSMSKAEKTIKSALLIQRWYRRYLARMEIRRRYTWTIFQNLEYAGEQDQVELYNFFNALILHMPEAAAEAEAARGRGSKLSLQSSVEVSGDSFEESVDRNYTGPHIQMPIGRKDVNALIDLFRKKKDNRLPPKYAFAILREAAIRLRRLPNLNQASTAISKQVTIVGDLHGKLDDLLVVLHKNGLPSTENPYVFNGDFVDRGKKSIEVFLMLLSCFLAFPGAVYLNRGNHEDSVMNARYGFIREVQQKYLQSADKILKMIDEVYRYLPLGTIVNNRVLIVHGGISDTTNLDLLKSLDRGKYVSILRPPVEATRSDSVDKNEWKQIFDIMWSDPQHSEGCIPNALRGAGTYFGPDITQRFLARYNFKYLVRSHECKPDGYEYTHDDRVITIFSASNYYAMGSNRGAYMKLSPQLEPHFVQYISAASKTKEMTFRQKVGLVESSAFRELGARLRAKRSELEAEFRKHDPQGTGIIPVSKWCDALESVTSLGLPWRLMREKLAPHADELPPNEVNYLSTLELLDTEIIIEAQMSETSVADSLYKNKSSLETIFHILDADHSGQISLDEFAQACKILVKYLPDANTPEELMEKCKMMDINGDGFVDLNEFLEAFRLCDQTRQAPTASLAPSTAGPTEERRKSLKVAAVAATLAKQVSDAEGEIDPNDHETKVLTPDSTKYPLAHSRVT